MVIRPALYAGHSGRARGVTGLDFGMVMLYLYPSLTLGGRRELGVRLPGLVSGDAGDRAVNDGLWRERGVLPRLLLAVDGRLDRGILAEAGVNNDRLSRGDVRCVIRRR